MGSGDVAATDGVARSVFGGTAIDVMSSGGLGRRSGGGLGASTIAADDDVSRAMVGDFTRTEVTARCGAALAAAVTPSLVGIGTTSVAVSVGVSINRAGGGIGEGETAATSVVDPMLGSWLPLCESSELEAAPGTLGNAAGDAVGGESWWFGAGVATSNTADDTGGTTVHGWTGVRAMSGEISGSSSGSSFATAGRGPPREAAWRVSGADARRTDGVATSDGAAEPVSDGPASEWPASESTVFERTASIAALGALAIVSDGGTVSRGDSGDSGGWIGVVGDDGDDGDGDGDGAATHDTT